jgi:hypothetical protein
LLLGAFAIIPDRPLRNLTILQPFINLLTAVANCHTVL